MDIIRKAILFDGKAIVSVVDAKELAQKAVDAQATSDGASEVLGRVLSIGAFLAAGVKGTNIKMSITIDGGGSLGKIIVAGESGGVVRGFVENRQAQLPKLANGHYDVSVGVGKKGSINVIKDFGMKEPYVGTSQIVNGSIDADFAYYFTASEQLPSAVSSGAIVENGKVKSCGVIVVQPMPNCTEDLIVVLQDIVRNFTDFGKVLLESTPDQIIEDNFGHFECKLLEGITPRFECKCSEERMDTIVKALGKEQAQEILDESGEIEIHCDFCNKYYRYNQEKIDKIFAK